MRRQLIGGVCGAVVVALVSGALAWAAPNPSPSPNTTTSPGQGLEISPPVVELSANPGQTITTRISIRNVTQGALLVKGEADDFGAGSSENGTPQILLNENGVTRYSLKYWISGVPNLTLAPQQLEYTTVTIKVPSNAEPGGHYAVVRFTGVPPNLSGTGVALSASVGTLILLRVNGAITDNLSLVQFAAGQQSKTTDFTPMSFFEHGPIAFVVRLHNGGTIHEAPKGTITVKDMFGRMIGTMSVNPTAGNVLPDSIRRFTQTLGNRALFGHYTATLNLTYAGKKTVTGAVGFWVIPWILILLILVGLVVIGYLAKVGIKRYNEHIIAAARKHR